MRILVVAGRHPFPTQRGDQLRALQCATSLASRHQVTLLVPESPFSGTIAIDLPFRVETFSRRLVLPVAIARTLASGLPAQNAFFAFPALARRLGELRASTDLIVLQLARLAQFMPPPEGPPVIVDLVDCLSLNFESRARRDRPWLRPLLAAESRRLARCEETLLERSRGALLVCDRDRRQLEQRLDPALHGRLRTVPIAMDVYRRRDASSAVRRPDTLAFSGNLGYFVNRDALLWFLDRVWPRLRRERPRLRLLAAGSRAAALRRRIERSGAELVDDPPDLREVLASATIALAPMQGGSGVPIKVLEAWSAGTPVVASPYGAAGVGVDEGALAVADTPEEWVETIGRLLDRPEQRSSLVAAGRATLARRHSSDLVRSGFLESVDLALDAGSWPVAIGSR